jgi:hypothetical protein
VQVNFLWRTRIIDYQLVMNIAKIATIPEKAGTLAGV